MTQPSHTAFITGASSGIGAIYAERLAARGYNLILAARREDRLQALADQLQARYAIQASILKADLSEEHGIAAVEQRLQQDPAIDLFINNAAPRNWRFSRQYATRAPGDSYAQHHRAAASELCRAGRFHPRRRGDADQYCLYPRAAYAAGQRSLQRSKAWVLSFTRGCRRSLPTAACVFRRYCRRRPLPICGRPPAWRWTLCPAAR